MFLTKEHFKESERIMQDYVDLSTEEEIKLAIAIDYARQMFEDFDTLNEDEKQEVLAMLLDEIPSNIYTIH